MAKPTSERFLFSVLACLWPISAVAQGITGSTTIDFDPNTGYVTATCETDLDADAQNWYEAVVDCSVTNDAGASVVSGQYIDHNGDLGYAQVVLTFAGSFGTTYTAVGTHLAVANLGDYAIPPPPQRPYYEYDDYYNFGYFASEGYPTYPVDYTWLGPGPETQRKTSTIKTGSTSDAVTVSQSCFAQLKYRKVPNIPFLANHSFWYMQDSNRKQWIIDAGPTGSCVGSCGFLNAWVTQGTVSSHFNKPPSVDSAGASVAYTAPVTAQLCTQVHLLYQFGVNWANNVTPYALDAAPNSNTFSHQAGTAAGFTNITAPPSAPGW